MLKRLIRRFRVCKLNNQLRECSYNMTFMTDYRYSDYKKDVDVIINQIHEIGYE